MDKMIIIPLNMFKLEQEIMILDQDGSHAFAQVAFTSLPEVITEASNVYGINEIKIIGNANYAQALSNEIKEYAIQNYSNKDINITIMEA